MSTQSDARGPICPECDGPPVGMEIRGVYDGVLFWKCFPCGLAWERAGFEGRRQEIAQSHIHSINAGRDQQVRSSVHPSCTYADEQLQAALSDLMSESA